MIIIRILIIEDEINLAETLKEILISNGYLVDTFYDGLEGYLAAQNNIYDLLLVDWMLPSLTGVEIIKKLRKEVINTPVIMLTAKTEIEDKINGLNTGADDYISKPFNTNELLARINANLRRRNTKINMTGITYEDLYLDKDAHKLYKDKQSTDLTQKEAELLELLFLEKTNVSSKDFIIDKVWGLETEVMHNHVEVYISFLRKKLEHLETKVKIKTIRSVGYTLEVKDV